MPSPAKDRVLRAAGTRAVLRPKDVQGGRNPREVIRELVRDGELVRVGHGLYERAGVAVSESISLAEVARRLPDGVVCLLSALSFHGLTTENPHEVWLAVAHKGRLQSGKPKVRVVRMSGDSFTFGVEEHLIDGVPVKIFSVAKTLADCFKFRSRIGIEIATAALRDGWRQRAFEMGDLWRAAGVCRVQKVIQPYVEML
jgi:predicted transcriptional regulator of viral defense system